MTAAVAEHVEASRARVSELVEELRDEYPGAQALGLLAVCGPDCTGHGGAECGTPGKRPIASGWCADAARRWADPDTEPAERLEIMAAHAARGGNLGWAPPEGVVVLDADTREAAAALDRALPDAPAQDTGRGAHYVVRLPEGVSVRATAHVPLAEGVSADLRPGGRSMIVCAPSVHASGTPYTWRRALPAEPAEIPEAPAWVVDAVRRAAEGTAGNGHTEERAEYERRPWDRSLPERVAAMLEADGELQRRFDRHPGREQGDHSQSGIDASLACMLAHPSRGLGGWEIEHALLASHAKAGLDDPKYDSRYFARCVGFAIKRAKQYTAEEATKPSAPEERSASATSDLANAYRLARLLADDARWVQGVGWIVWAGARWQASEDEAVRRASRLGRVVHAEASDCERRAAEAETDADRERLSGIAEALIKWARASESASRIRAAMDLARPYLALRPERLDADPYLLATASGTVDLRTGALREHRREDYLTRMTVVRYDPAARSELWERVLERAIPDPATRAYVQRVAGYSACGECGEDVLVVIHGPTRTAKGTVQGAIAAALGEYAQTAGLEDLAERDRAGGASPELARLRGARMVSVYETSARLRLAPALVKTLAGSDPITVRALYREPITYVPTYTVWLATNHRPRVPAEDDALWERIREVPLRTQIPRGERDPAVRRRLADPEEAGPAVLRWIVEGALAWQREGLEAPPEVEAATEDYREEVDPLAGWLSACCVLRADAWALTADLRRSYETWCRESGERPVGARTWQDGLRRHGCEGERRHAGRGWRGIGLVTPGGVTP